MKIKEINYHVAKPFIEKYHYSERVPTGHNIFFGWFTDECDLYAVANYGHGVNPYQSAYLSRILGKEVRNDNCLELKRLCRREPVLEDTYLSSFVSKCHKALKLRGIRHIVSFSDPTHGHSGGIYRASNFDNLGKTNPEFHLIDKEGNIRHRRYAYRYAKRNNVSTQEARKILGLTRIKTNPKTRWYISI